VAAADTPGADQQERVNAYFDAQALYWQGVYDDPRLQGVIYRARQEAVLAAIDDLGLAQGAAVLEIGCGAGLLTVELARRGHSVRAVDSSQAMVELTRRRAQHEGVGALVDTQVADVHALPFGDDSVSLVVAVGLLPWLHEPGKALREMARVLRPAGDLVLTADNRARLSSWVDPRANVLLAPLKRLRRRLRPRPELGARSRLHFPSHVDSLVRASGFQILDRRTVGFGPFSFLGRPLLSDRAGVRLHHQLQALADRRVPLLRSTGWHYLLSTRKHERAQ
jgi:ubiquinone/menaquinone biosynthesis C-methylase UbiE